MTLKQDSAMTAISPIQAGKMLIDRLKLPENVTSVTLTFTPTEATVTIECLPDAKTMEFITTRFDLVPRHDPQD